MRLQKDVYNTDKTLPNYEKTTPLHLIKQKRKTRESNNMQATRISGNMYIYGCSQKELPPFQYKCMATPQAQDPHIERSCVASYRDAESILNGGVLAEFQKIHVLQ